MQFNLIKNTQILTIFTHSTFTPYTGGGIFSEIDLQATKFYIEKYFTL